MKWLFYGFVALVVAAVVILLVKMLLLLALAVGIGYGVYRWVKWLGEGEQRKAARHQHTLDEIERLERELGNENHA